jgi:hypothetical protein
MGVHGLSHYIDWPAIYARSGFTTVENGSLNDSLTCVMMTYDPIETQDTDLYIGYSYDYNWGTKTIPSSNIHPRSSGFAV